MKVYAGIGSRKTPVGILEIMTETAKALEARGWTLRSGNAEGADQAFQAGTKKAEVFLPWPGYNKRTQQRDHDRYVLTDRPLNIQVAANNLTELYHPTPTKLTPATRKLHGRNALILFGPNCRPIDMVSWIICWTPNGEISGGTGQTLRMASDFPIKITNLGNPDDLRKARQFLDQVNRPELIES